MMGGRWRPWLASLDMYRKVPGDLLEGSREGRVVSWIALSAILYLFLRETQQFFTSRMVADLSLDAPRQGSADKLRVKFNITMMDVRCEYATVNVVSVLGNEQNVTKDIRRWNLNSSGDLQETARRNPENHNIIHFDPSVTSNLTELHQNGIDAVRLDWNGLDTALEEYNFVFVNFFASWCIHCRNLEPTWERFAEMMHDVGDNETHTEDYSEEEYKEATKLKAPVLIASVDCVEQEDLCWDRGIEGYPTLTMFVGGDNELGGDYTGDRTILDFLHALTEVEKRVLTNEEAVAQIRQHAEIAAQKHLNMSTEHKEWIAMIEKHQHKHHTETWDSKRHPGCLLTGTLLMNRVPGRFFIQAQGGKSGRDLAPRMANLSHQVHHLSFESAEAKDHARDTVLPVGFEEMTHPMDGKVYATKHLHQAYHHYIKLVSTNSHFYKVLENSQLVYYAEDKIPEAKFVLDISAIAVHYRTSSRPWYDYLTSLLAIVGGTFTVVGLVDSLFYHAVLRSKRALFKRPPPPLRQAP